MPFRHGFRHCCFRALCNNLNPFSMRLKVPLENPKIKRFYSFTTPVSDEKETIVKLLDNIGSRREVELYLQHFTSVESQKFAVIKVGGAVLQDHLTKLASALSFLQRVGLYPIVVHGAGPQLNKLLEAKGIKPRYREGIRVTDSEILDLIRLVFQAENLRLVEALESLGTRARPINGGVFTAEPLNFEKYGYVGKIVDVNKSMIESCITSGSLPILTSMAETLDGQILNVNADIAASMIARVIEPLKVVYLNNTGGLIHGETGDVIDIIDLDKDYEKLLCQPWVTCGTRLKLNQIKELLDHLPRTSSACIISADHLQKELFTVSGAGTLIRRGFKVHLHKGLQDVDLDRFRSLMEENDPDVRAGNISVARYLQRLTDKETNAILYHDEAYEMVAALTPLSHIIEGCSPEILFMDRLIATKGAELQGLTDHLWRRIRMEQPSLFWTVPKTDEHLGWHFDRSEGSFALSEVTLFWYGISDIDQIASIVEAFKDYRPPHYNGPQPAYLNSGHRPSNTPEAVLASSSLFKTELTRNQE
ncbi:hypothetical protein L0F63_006824 [Massospora cicadina]|nr:hypothetical protein L0F63_006824 [Massospora cicadina]